MERKNKGAISKDHTLLTNGTKIAKEKNIWRVLNFFRYKVGSTLDCSMSTGILRNCVTWYVQQLEEQDMLQAVVKCKDRTTGFMAKHYSADKSLWRKKSHELFIFDESDVSNG